jgi:hypothetical protein
VSAEQSDQLVGGEVRLHVLLQNKCVERVVLDVKIKYMKSGEKSVVMK